MEIRSAHSSTSGTCRENLAGPIGNWESYMQDNSALLLQHEAVLEEAEVHTAGHQLLVANPAPKPAPNRPTAVMDALPAQVALLLAQPTAMPTMIAWMRGKLPGQLLEPPPCWVTMPFYAISTRKSVLVHATTSNRNCNDAARKLQGWKLSTTGCNGRWVGGRSRLLELFSLSLFSPSAWRGPLQGYL